MSPTAPPASRSRRAALIVLCAGMLMIILDGSIVTVALPAIQDDLGFSPAGLTWTVNAYMIAFGGLLLLAGRLGDLIGHKRMFIAGLLLFTTASLLCGLSTGPEMLIAARFVQGIGGAMASAVSLGMIVTLFPEPHERGKAIGAFSFVGATGASIGQVLGGILTEAIGWHWIFFINLPIGVAAAVLALRVLDSDRGRGLRAGADALGALLVTAGLMLGVYTIVETGRHGWGSARTLGLAALAILLLTAFVVRQATAATPLLPLRMFRSRNVSGANLIQILLISAAFGFQILVALYMQNVLGYGALRTGLALLPAAMTIGAVSLGLSARLNARFGERTMLLAGLVLVAAGLSLLTRLPVEADYVVHLLPTMLLVGGFGLAISALTSLGMSGAGPGDAGVASGLFNTTQQVGGALGVAVLSTLAATRTEDLLADGHGTASALTGGYHLAFGIGAGLAVAGFVLAATVLRQPGASAGPQAPEAAATEETTREPACPTPA
ncbi:DHA2 family efflux MFS transporter permease subunit [Actinomadura alba]|uniref:DHA2 family efflux MFS transporter permease subunit n=1 Tax=Actinomadura alba TaxID=406431 RepID=A0ABR7LK34_9ACTN|nr:DHA2 family efflux MFS transporter permease subunit [Actinomadura alba]MBC6465215.1 DHA2 family efflux MFS transporter permease subunit [Actinomadura alba]